MTRTLRSVCVAAALAVAALGAPAHAAGFELVSSNAGPRANSIENNLTAVSGNGRFAAYVVYGPYAFGSSCTGDMNLPPGTPNQCTPRADLPSDEDALHGQDLEIWYADLVTKRRVRVAAISGDDGGSCCTKPLSMSRDGRYVVFEAYIGPRTKTTIDVTPKDTNKMRDVYVWDARTQKITRMLSVKGTQLPDGAYGGAVSADGRTVVYQSAADVFVKENQQRPPCALYKYSLVTRRTTVVEAAGQPVCAFTAEFAVSADARYLAVATQQSFDRSDEGGMDVYWVDSVKHRAALVSEPRVTATAGASGETYSGNPSIDGSGNLVAWEVGAPMTYSPDAQIRVRDIRSGRLIDVAWGAAGPRPLIAVQPRLSENGRWLTYTEVPAGFPLSDHYDLRAVWVRDLTKDASTTSRLEPLGSCTSPVCAHPASQAAVPSGDGSVIVYVTNTPQSPEDKDQAFDVYAVRR